MPTITTIHTIDKGCNVRLSFNLAYTLFGKRGANVRGVVREVEDNGPHCPAIARVDWNRPDMAPRVLVTNLRRIRGAA